jgi:hypothetical protein
MAPQSVSPIAVLDQFGPLIVGMAALFVLAWRWDSVTRRLDPDDSATSERTPPGKFPRGALTRIRYIGERVLSIAAVIAIFRTNKMTAWTTVVILASAMTYHFYRRRLMPLREKGATTAEFLTLTSLLALTMLGTA